MKLIYLILGTLFFTDWFGGYYITHLTNHAFFTVNLLFFMQEDQLGLTPGLSTLRYIINT